MNKQNFIADLTKALEGIVPNNVIHENIGYYRTYIEQEVKKGFSEQQVLEELGDPRLIARTIIDASGVEYTGGFDESGGTPRSSAFQEEKGRTRDNIKFKQYDFNKWYWKILTPIIFVVIIVLVVVLISAFFGGAFYLLALLIRYSWIIFLIACLYWFIKGLK